MELHRHCSGRIEAVHSSEFVAFWANSGAVVALDLKGMEWRLAGRLSLKGIEAAVDGFARAHRRALVRISAVDRLMARDGQGHYCVLLGREFPVSGAHRPGLQSQYRALAAKNGFSNLGVARAA